ncbi:hypothetical protein GC197_03100 [bacterium]|nr:hypothetical protein [bacterium]
MTSAEDYPAQCPNCGLVLLRGNLFDAAECRSQYGPILGIDDDANKEDAQAGYVGLGSLWCYDWAPDIYRCPRCRVDPIQGQGDGNAKVSTE